MKAICNSLVVACAALLVASSAAFPEPATDFYRGKTINLYVGFPPGGGYDIYARVLAPHFSRHIPGNPAVVVKNMEGGSGLRVASFISHATPQDGTSLGVLLDLLTLGKVLGGPGEFDPVKLTWIGRIVSTATVSVVWHTSPVQTIEQAKAREITVAASFASSNSSFFPLALNDLIGTKFKVIRGYQGSPNQSLAMERGEVDAIGGIALEAIQTTKPDWLTEKKVKVLYSQAAKRLRELPDDPAVVEFAVDQRSRNILTLLASGPDIGRAVVAEPGVPPERAAALRMAFMATMADPQFVAEMGQRHLGIEPLTGEEVHKIVAAAGATPRELVEQAKRYIGQ